MTHAPGDPSSARPAGRPDRDRIADVHVPFVYTALAFGVLGGFSLAFSLAVEAWLAGISLSWAVHAQVHGHLQVVGFAGLFVAGVALKLIPRFGNGTVPRPHEVTAVLWCLGGGVLARALGQPIVPYTPVGAVAVVAGAALELAGALLFARIVFRIMGAGIRRGEPHAVQIGAGAFWLAAASALGLGWLGAMVWGGDRLLRADHDAVLLTMLLFGFILDVFTGVGLRSFPALFGMPSPSRGLGLGGALLLQGGLALWAGGSLIEVARVTAFGQAGVGGGILLLASSFGFWRRETRFAAASQPLAWALRGALLSLTLTGALLVVHGAGVLMGDRGVWIPSMDSVRHVFALGVVTLGIVGMAQLILPEFASERLVRRPSPRRGPLFAAAILAAVLLRGVVPMLPVDSTVRWASMALAGTLAWIAAGAFAVLFIRARRAHLAYLARMAKWRAEGGELQVVE